jgi:hypothetical protein
MNKEDQDLAIQILREEIERVILSRPLRINKLKLLTYWYKKLVSEL